MCILCNLAGVESGGLGCRGFFDPVDAGAGDHNAALAQANAADGGVGAPSAFSLAQIVQQLRTQWGGAYEGTTESWPGTGAINYYIGGAPFSTGEEGAYKVNMTALMQSRATLAFELWDDLIARDLNQVSTAAFGQIQFEYASRTYNANNVLATNGGTYSRSWFNANGTNAYGTANYGTTRDEIWLNSNWTSHDQDGDLFLGGYGFQTYLHEIGHSLGLSHPGTYNAGNNPITYANNAEYSLDNRQYTIMSYFGGYAPGAGWQQDGTFSNWLYSSTPMLHDVAAIQAIYGADMTTRAGDTTYGFHSNARRDVFDFTIDTSPIVTVWDGGGNDTIDVSGYSAPERIDLRAGMYSDVGGMLGNFAIAYNVTIENAVGGSGNDTIIGNDAGNTLRGGSGNDTIDGGAGADFAVFAGARAAYTLTALGGGAIQVVGPDGTDTLTNVEQLIFDNQTVAVQGLNNPPVASIANHTLHATDWAHVADWVLYSDADGNPATQYQFIDNGFAANSAHFWTPSTGNQPAGAPLTVAAAELSNLWLGGGTVAGSEQMWIRAFDGANWGEWRPFTLTTEPNRPPDATIADHALHARDWAHVADWISYSDPDGNPATQFQFSDNGLAAGSAHFWTSTGGNQPAGTPITVAAADISNLWLGGATASGSEQIWMRAFDGMDWGTWRPFTLTTPANHAPDATIADQRLHVGDWAHVANWIGYSDADGDPATQFQFSDNGTAPDSAHFWTPAGGHQPSGAAITVAAADLGNLWLGGATAAGTEQIWMRAFDGTDWGMWRPFTLTDTLV